MVGIDIFYKQIINIMRVNFILFLFIHTTLTYAQLSNGIKDLKIGVLYGYSASSITYSLINKHLTTNSYYPIKSTNVFSVPDNVNVGFEFYKNNDPNYARVLLNKSFLLEQKSYNSAVSHLGFSVDVFRNLLNKDKWVLAPMVGVNLLDFNLSAISISEISALTQTNMQERLSRENIWLIRTGIDMKHFVMIPFEPIKSFGIGFNIYYQIDISNGKWSHSSPNEINAFPATKLSGLVLAINTVLNF